MLNLLALNRDLLHWQELWDVFDSTIKVFQTYVVKFSYLMNTLRGAAASEYLLQMTITHPR